MALSLNQISKNKSSVPVSKSLPPKKQLLRPWQSFDTLGAQTRTVAAKEAVDRARQISVIRAERTAPPVYKSIEPKEISTSIKAGGLFDFLNFLF